MATGFMCWHSPDSDGQKILWLREPASVTPALRVWHPYTKSPHRLNDPADGLHSKGWMTYNKLFKAGWQLLPTINDSPGQPLASSTPGSPKVFIPLSGITSEVRNELLLRVHPDPEILQGERRENSD